MQTFKLRNTIKATVISPPSKLFSLRLGELWEYRDLIILWIQRDITALYKQTFLGYFWYMLQAIFMASIFSVVFGRFVKIPTDGMPSLLFFMSGFICWSYVHDVVQNVSMTFQSNSGLFSKVYFPRLAIPIAQLVVFALKFFIQLGVFLAIVCYYQLTTEKAYLSLEWFYIPLIMLQLALLAMGTGLLVASFTTRYRDLNFVLAFFMQIWMYASPIIYSTNQIPDHWRHIYYINPMASIISAFRHIFFQTEFSGTGLFVSICSTVAITLIGLILFQKSERTFLDTI